LLSIVDRLSGSARAAIVTVDPAIILAAYAALNMIVLSVRKGSWRQNNQCGHDAVEFDFHHHFACCTAAIITRIFCLRDSGVPLSRQLRARTQPSMNKLTGKYSERRRLIWRFFDVWGQRRDEHEEATYLGAGNSARRVFRGIGRGRWQQAQGVCGCPSFLQSSSSQEVFGHPFHEAAELRKRLRSPARQGKRSQGQVNDHWPSA
jgi:hypothetical protein